MDDIFMKYGLVLVGVAIIGIMLAFVYAALTNTQLIPGKEETNLKGDHTRLVQKISALCNRCTTDKDTNRECNVVELTLDKGNISSSLFSKNIKLLQNITAGHHIIRISSKNLLCEVDLIE